MADSAELIEEIKKNLKEEKVIIGTKEVMRALQKGELSKIIFASNPSTKSEGDIESYAKVLGCQTVKLEVPNDELGTVCKKQFLISVVGIRK
jgi:ribosomal protein L30E